MAGINERDVVIIEHFKSFFVIVKINLFTLHRIQAKIYLIKMYCRWENSIFIDIHKGPAEIEFFMYFRGRREKFQLKYKFRPFANIERSFQLQASTPANGEIPRVYKFYIFDIK